MMVRLVYLISWTIELETTFSVTQRQYANETKANLLKIALLRL